MLGKGLAEGGAGLGVVHAGLQAGSNDSRRARRDRVSTVIKRGHRDLEALALVANAVLERHRYILKTDPTRASGAHAKLAVDIAARYPSRGQVDKECRQSLHRAGWLRVRSRRDQRKIGLGSQRDPHLLAVEHVIIALAPG